jgi:hypothetical protein
MNPDLMLFSNSELGKPSASAINPETSHAAAESMAGAAPTVRKTIMKVIRDSGLQGATDDEIEQITGLKHQTASAARRSLSKVGHVVDSGERRNTSSGRKAIVWIANPYAR